MRWPLVMRVVLLGLQELRRRSVETRRAASLVWNFWNSWALQVGDGACPVSTTVNAFAQPTIAQPRPADSQSGTRHRQTPHAARGSYPTCRSSICRLPSQPIRDWNFVALRPRARAQCDRARRERLPAELDWESFQSVREP